jgi:hypothetical protein
MTVVLSVLYSNLYSHSFSFWKRSLWLVTIWNDSNHMPPLPIFKIRNCGVSYGPLQSHVSRVIFGGYIGGVEREFLPDPTLPQFLAPTLLGS